MSFRSLPNSIVRVKLAQRDQPKLKPFLVFVPCCLNAIFDTSTTSLKRLSVEGSRRFDCLSLKHVPEHHSLPNLVALGVTSCAQQLRRNSIALSFVRRAKTFLHFKPCDDWAPSNAWPLQPYFFESLLPPTSITILSIIFLNSLTQLPVRIPLEAGKDLVHCHGSRNQTL